MEWHHALGLTPTKLRWHQHGPDELAHYARAAYDIQYEFPFGWQEIEGIHNRATSIWGAIRSIPARSSSTSTRRPTSAISRTSWRRRPARTG